MDKQLSLGEFEEIVLLTIMRLGATAYGVSIRQTLKDVAGRNDSYGAIYTTLERLEQKGFIRSREGEPTAQRGGRAKRYYELTGMGAQALNEAQQVRDRLREGVSPGLQPAGGAI